MKSGKDYIGVGIGAVILNNEGKIFMSKRGMKSNNEKGKWECPGGTLEFGESFEECLKREIKEEFGIEIELLHQLEPYNHFIPDENQHWVALCFVAKLIKGIPTILEPHKSDAIGWFTREEMEKMDLATYTRKRLQQMKEYTTRITS